MLHLEANVNFLKHLKILFTRRLRGVGGEPWFNIAIRFLSSNYVNQPSACIDEPLRNDKHQQELQVNILACFGKQTFSNIILYSVMYHNYYLNWLVFYFLIEMSVPDHFYVYPIKSVINIKHSDNHVNIKSMLSQTTVFSYEMRMRIVCKCRVASMLDERKTWIQNHHNVVQYICSIHSKLRALCSHL